MAFQALYTGENSAVKLPDLDSLIQSQERMGSKMIAGQEKILQRKEKDSAFVLEQMKANPVLLITDKLRTAQSEAIKNYNNFGAKLLAENDGILSDDAKLALQREKDALTMSQQSMMADQQRFQQEYALMQKDQGAFYDEKEFTKGMNAFYETGKYPQTSLIAKPQSFLNALSKDNANFTQTRDKKTQVVDGVEWQYDVVKNMTPEEGRRYIVDKAMKNEAYLRDVISEFDKLPESEQMKYLDSNGDGAVDPTEKEQVRSAMDVNNPIMKWAQDYYLPYVMKESELTGTRTPVSAKAGGGKPFNVNIAVGGGNNRNSTYPLSSESRTVGKFTFPTFVDVKKSTTGSVALNNPINAETGQVVPVNAQAELDIVGYSPQTDQITVRVKKSTRGLRENQTLILDGNTYKNVLEGIGIHRESYQGFGKGETQTGQPSFQGSYAEYKKKYPNGTPEEYRTLTGAK